jgi:N-acetylglucosaminyldiphosphoundecaprenol N-acetyl-beta-D-mannosaminyltransferase
MNKPALEKTNILGVGVSRVNRGACLELISQWIQNGDHQYICVTGVHGVMESQRDSRLRTIHNQAGMVTPDGMPLVWLNWLSGHRDVSRVYGPDLMFDVLQRSVNTGWKHYFYGGRPEVVGLLAEKMAARFVGLQIVGFESPPYRKLTEDEEKATLHRINASGAHIVWVGLGTPKQELWMAEHIAQLKAGVMIGVGAAFDFHAGVKKQAPHWMQRFGLEWFFRLLTEPGRLWRRYLINNPLFIWSVFLQYTGLKKFPLN